MELANLHEVCSLGHFIITSTLAGSAQFQLLSQYILKNTSKRSGSDSSKDVQTTTSWRLQRYTTNAPSDSTP